MRFLSWVSFCLLLLSVKELDCILQWEVPHQDLRNRILSQLYRKTYQRRDAMRTASKVSREALHFGLEWASWRQRHNKSYFTSEEALERYVVWRSNTAYIQYHNKYADKFGFTLAMNGFGDMTTEEYIQNMRCVESAYYRHDPSDVPSLHGHVPPLNVTYFDGSQYSKGSLPEEVNWRTMGAVTDIKDQGRCKSCYAFATTAALEGMHALATGKLISLSEQNIIDCSIPYGNRGCSGGSRMSSIMYIVDNGGVDRTSSYPYIGRQYLCRFNEESIVSGCTGLVRTKHGNELELQKAVAGVGPITVAIDSRHTSFQFYADGIYSEPSCSRSKLTHTLVIIGYGKKKGKEYWLLKNSWGASWGMNGYIMMTRNSANQCGIASKAMYITI